MPMKKALAPALFLLLALAAPASEARIMLGIHSSKYLFSSEVTTLNRQQKSGVAIGLGYELEINPRMSLEADAVYGEKGAKASIEYTPGQTIFGTYSNRALALPILFKYRLKEGRSPYAALGPELNFILAHTLSIPEYEEKFDVSASTNKLIVAINAALGYELPFGRWGLFAEARYNRWLSNLWKSSDASVNSESLSFLLGGIYYL